MRPLRVFVCEDEEVSLGINQVVLEHYLKKRNITADIIYRDNYNEQDEQILKNTELAILDIDLKGSNINGIELAQKMRKMNPCTVFIFITAHIKFAYEADQLHLSGFLGKPLNQYDFRDSMDQAIALVNGYRIMNSNNKIATFRNNRVTLKERSIISIEKIAKSHEVVVSTTEKNFQVYDSIRNIEKNLSDHFVKINRSVIVNLSYVFDIEDNIVRLRGGASYEIPIRNLENVRNAYEEYVTRKLV